MTWVLGAGGVKTWGGGRLYDDPPPAPERCRQRLDGMPHVNHGATCCAASAARRRELTRSTR